MWFCRQLWQIQLTEEYCATTTYYFLQNWKTSISTSGIRRRRKSRRTLIWISALFRLSNSILIKREIADFAHFFICSNISDSQSMPAADTAIVPAIPLNHVNDVCAKLITLQWLHRQMFSILLQYLLLPLTFRLQAQCLQPPPPAIKLKPHD